MRDDGKRAAIYCRTAGAGSTAADTGTIEKQRIQLRDFARRHGFTVTAEFADNGYSGLTLDRPAFQKMNEAVRAGEIDAVFVRDLSRISRNLVEYHCWRRQMKEKHIFVVSLHDGPI